MVWKENSHQGASEEGNTEQVQGATSKSEILGSTQRIDGKGEGGKSSQASCQGHCQGVIGRTDKAYQVRFPQSECQKEKVVPWDTIGYTSET